MDDGLPTVGLDVPAGAALPTMAKGFGPRAVSYVIDVAVIWGLVRLLVLTSAQLIPFVLAAFGLELYQANNVEQSYLLDMVDGVVTSTLYFAVFESLFGASIGKLILGMRVVQLDGRLCRLGPALVRGILRFIDGLVFAIPAASSMAKDPVLRQRLGDRAAQTIVVDRRDPFIRDRRAPWRLLVAPVAFMVLAHVWVLVYGPASGQTYIAPRVELVTVAAAEANLQETDFDPGLTMSEEYGPGEFTGFSGTDVSERLFVSEAAAVQSRVMLFDFVLTDLRADLAAFGKDGLAKELPGAQLSADDDQSALVGDLAVIRRFAEAETGNEGYVVAFRRGNALVRLIFYGPPGRFSAEQASTIAALVDARLTSSSAESR
jgi:uncharacterized RDD family membrane protein YckC